MKSTISSMSVSFFDDVSMRKLPPMTSLAAFDAVARSGSVSAASDELGRTHGAVSRQIRNLEADTALALFEKQGNGIRLTQHGRDLHLIVGKALNILEHEIGNMRRLANDRTIYLGISPTLALKWLMPRLANFHAQFPDIEIRLCMTGRDHLTVSDCDIILSYDRLSWDHRQRDDFHIIGDVDFGLVMSQATTVQKTDGGCLVPARLYREDHLSTWHAWEALSGVSIDAARSIHFPQTALVLEAAAAGQGVALAERRLVADDLRRGRLITPFGFIRIPDGFVALMSPKNPKFHSLKKLLNWLGDEAAQVDRGKTIADQSLSR